MQRRRPIASLSEIIEGIVSGLDIPEELTDQARREGHIAFCEKRDIKAAISYWLEQQVST